MKLHFHTIESINRTLLSERLIDMCAEARAGCSNGKKILVVDDSALMRRVLCDIIDTDERFQVVARATNGLEALDLLSRNQYDAVVLDVNMPRMNGLELLEELQKRKIPARVMMASTDTREGAKTTMDALELGALDFIHKPDSAVDCRADVFKDRLLRVLDVVANSRLPVFESREKVAESQATVAKMADIARKFSSRISGTKVVAIASSQEVPRHCRPSFQGFRRNWTHRCCWCSICQRALPRPWRNV